MKEQARPHSIEEELLRCRVKPEERLPARSIIVQLSGRSFDALLDAPTAERPFDPSFAKSMVKTLSYLAWWWQSPFGFADRTTLSMLLPTQRGGAHKFIEFLSSVAAARLALFTGRILTFDCMLFCPEDGGLAVDYFCRRQQLCSDTAVERYLRHVLEQSGAQSDAVPHIVDGLGVEEKVELLRQKGVDFDQLPEWQTHGVCVRTVPESTAGDATTRLTVDLKLPFDGAFRKYVRSACGPG